MSAETVSSTEVVYVYLLNEGTDVWRPTLAVRLDNLEFKLLSTTDYDPGDEEWEFPPGSIVECGDRVLDGERVLVAVKLAAVGSDRM